MESGEVFIDTCVGLIDGFISTLMLPVFNGIKFIEENFPSVDAPNLSKPRASIPGRHNGQRKSTNRCHHYWMIAVNGNITSSVLLVDVIVNAGNSDCSNQVTEESSVFLTLVKARSVTPVQARSVTASMMSFLIVTHT